MRDGTQRGARDGAPKQEGTPAARSGSRWWAPAAGMLVLGLAAAAWMLGMGDGISKLATETRGDPFQFGVYAGPEDAVGASGPARDRAERLAGLLSNAVDQPVEVKLFDRHVALTRALASGELDAARLNPYDYVRAAAAGEAEAVLQAVRYGRDAYRAQFVTLEGSGIDSLADLSEKRVAFADPSSVSGYLLPVAFLERQGFSIDSVQLTFSGSHEQVIRDVMAGNAAAGVTFKGAENLWKSESMPALPETAAPLNRLRVFAVTDGLPHELIAVRSELPDPIRRSLATGLQALTERSEGRHLIEAWWNVEGFVPADRDGLALLEATLAHLPS